MRRRFVFGIVIVLTLLSFGIADAEVVYDGSYIMQVTDVMVSGSSFDFDFRHGSCVSVFNESFDFAIYGDAQEAVAGILGQLNSEVVVPGWNTGGNYFYIPYRIDESGFDAIQGIANDSDPASVEWQQFAQFDLDPLENMVFAKTSAVPLPSAAWIFGSGILGLGAFRMKFKK